MEVDLKELQARVDKKLIGVQKHPTHSLLIWNYTPACQFNKENWDEYTRMCRGLITDEDGTVFARPFSKFFNLSEHEGETAWMPKLNWNQEFICTKKMDGSLGILYFIDQKPQIATRGSFTSTQSVKATEMAAKYKLDWLDTLHFTYLFEIIYPENRIVIDYKDKEELVLLDVIDIENGRSVDWQSLSLIAEKMECPCVQRVLTTPEALKNIDEYVARDEDEEGYVIRFEDGTRIKVKFEEYVRLHRLFCGVNARTIWDHLRWGTGFEKLLDHVPDEFNGWVKKIVAELSENFDKTKNEIEEAWLEIMNMVATHWHSPEPVPRKLMAELILKYPEISSPLFQKLDGKPYNKFIWSKIRPEASLPFHDDIDA